MKIPASLYRLALVLILGATLGLGGCATGDDRDPRDPLEPLNRVTYKFNDMLDRALIKPLAQGYEYIMPAPANQGVTNFFNNLADIRSALNNLLQLKVGRAFSDVGRVAINSTVGILGLIDVASNMNLPRYGEDFGQTLGVWGLAPVLLSCCLCWVRVPDVTPSAWLSTGIPTRSPISTTMLGVGVCVAWR